MTFTGAPGTGDKECGADYTATTVESTTAVVVVVTEHRHPGSGTCTMMGATRTWVTDEFEHNGLRASGDRVLGRLMDMAAGLA